MSQEAAALRDHFLVDVHTRPEDAAIAPGTPIGMRELGAMNSAAPEFPLAVAAIAPLRAKAESLGRDDFSPLWAGQNATGCKAVSAAELTRELAAGLRG